MKTKLQALIELNEGRRNKLYLDSMGIETIGVGHNLRARPISDAAIDLIFADDLRDHQAELERICPWLDEHDEVRVAALTDMCFNLGPAGLAGFKNMLAHFKEKVYLSAAIEAEQSRWFKQVGDRGPRIVNMIRTGLWPREIST